jgi:glycerate dehydrogenase
MKIGILDGFTLFQSDIDWKNLQSFGEVYYLDRVENGLIPENLLDSDVLITNKFSLNESNLPLFPNLKLIIVSATGYNCVDTDYCRNHHIQVANVPNYGTYSVAQHAMALLLNYSNSVEMHIQAVQKGEWESCKDFSFQKKPLIELFGKTMGIIGMGAIGKAFACMCKSLGMQVIYSHTRDLLLEDFAYVTLEELGTKADFISLHCPLNAQTNQLINKSFLAQAKSNLVLINTSRGGLIHSQDLANALEEGKIAAALLDVLEVEPPRATNPLLHAKNCYITPHNAWISFEARTRIFDIIKEIAQSFLDEKTINRIV